MRNTLYIGVDFHPHQQTIAWCDTATGETDLLDLQHDSGLEALEKESAGKRKRAGISKAGNALTRYLVGQSGQIATRYDPNLKSFYKRLAKRKPKGVAKMATARKLLVKLVIMWRDNITAQEFDGRGSTSKRCSANSRSAKQK